MVQRESSVGESLETAQERVRCALAGAEALREGLCALRSGAYVPDERDPIGAALDWLDDLIQFAPPGDQAGIRDTLWRARVELFNLGIAAARAAQQ